jgi:hypothetical protein
VAGDYAKSPIDSVQKQIVEKVRSAGRLVIWPDDISLAILAPARILVEGAKDIMAVPRANLKVPSAPAIIHLLNRRYDAANDAVIPADDFTLRLRGDLFAGRKLTKAVMHAPNSQPIPLAIAADKKTAAIRVPRLELWGVVELSD